MPPTHLGRASLRPATWVGASKGASPTEQDAKAVAGQIKQPATTKVGGISQDNDPNDLIGGPNGYVNAAVVHHSNVECKELGIE